MWDKIKAFFKNSMTIFWARVQVLLAVVWGVLSTVDLSPILPSKWLPVWLVISGVVTELARRRTL